MGKIVQTCYALFRSGAVIVMLHFFLFSVAQATGDPKVTVLETNVPLKFVFKKIEKQTHFRFNYSDSELNVNEKVSVKYEDVPLNSVLSDLLSKKGLQWKIIDKNIYLKKSNHVENAPSLSTFMSDSLNVISITGRIVDKNGAPLVGATVLVKNTSKGASTKADGVFNIQRVNPESQLSISCIGYKPVVVVASENMGTITLQEDISGLDETVVKGYYNTSKRLNTGNVSTVRGEDIEKQPVSNPLAALEGRVPGLYIQQNSGVPGGGFTVMLRGRNSIASGNNPLYIVDGVPYTSKGLASDGLAYTINGTGSSPLNTINPADIASIDVLKDADATSIYGSRGANGVILITTKRGKAGTQRVDFNLYSGFGNVARKMKMLNTRQYLDMRYEALKNDGITLTSAIPNAYDLTKWDTTMNTDFTKLLFGGSSKINDVQGTISGGNVNTQFLTGVGYHRETTVFPGNFADRKISFHFNINHTSVNQRLKLLITGNYIYEDNQLPTEDITKYIILAPNTPALYDANGNLNFGSAGAKFDNPLAYTKKRYKGNTSNLIGNASLSYELLPRLNFRLSAGYTTMTKKEIYLVPSVALDPTLSQLSSSRFSNNNINTWITEPQLTWQKQIGNGQLNILVGGTIQQDLAEGAATEGVGYSSDALIENILAADTKTIFDFHYSQYRYMAGFGRVNYNLKNRYLINLTGRRDGSSRFGPGKQFSDFGALGLGWIFTSENFIKNIFPGLTFGKLRASYGVTGNDQIPDYQFLNAYGAYDYGYQGISVLYPKRLFNANFAWERNRKLEAAIEMVFLQDRISLSTSYYRNKSSNQLLYYNLPPTSGFDGVLKNLPAVVQNTGWEIELNTVNVRHENFTWTSSINITLPRNKLIAYPDLANSTYATTYSIGKSLFVQNVYPYMGVNPQTGVYEFRDINGKTTSAPSAATDKQFIIDNFQKYYGGVLNNFQYRGLQLSLLLQFVKQTGNNYMYSGFGAPGFIKNQPRYVLDRWQKAGDLADVQQFTQSSSSLAYTAFNNGASGENRFTDASFIRLKNVSLSYQLSSKLTRKIGIQSSRIYLQGQNLLTITRYRGNDPENQGLRLPPLRMLTGGVNLTL